VGFYGGSTILGATCQIAQPSKLLKFNQRAKTWKFAAKCTWKDSRKLHQSLRQGGTLELGEKRALVLEIGSIFVKSGQVACTRSLGGPALLGN
jgi:hypothetical protein